MGNTSTRTVTQNGITQDEIETHIVATNCTTATTTQEDSELVSDIFIPDVMAVICEFLPWIDFCTLTRIKPFRTILKQTPLPYIVTVTQPNYPFFQFCFRRVSFAPFSYNQINNALNLAIECNKLQEIELPCISMQSQSTKQFWSFAKRSTRLKRLFLGKNNLNEKTVLDELIDLASSNSYLRQIWLRLEQNWLDYLYQQLLDRKCHAIFCVSVYNSFSTPTVTVTHSNILLLNEFVKKEIELPIMQNALLKIRFDAKFSLEIKSQADINLSNYDYAIGTEPIEYILKHAKYIRTVILGFSYNSSLSKALQVLLSVDKIHTLQTTTEMDGDALNLLITYVKTSRVLGKLVLQSIRFELLKIVLKACGSSSSLKKISSVCPFTDTQVMELTQLVPDSIEYDHASFLRL